jgi:hypothetical protein
MGGGGGGMNESSFDPTAELEDWGPFNPLEETVGVCVCVCVCVCEWECVCVCVCDWGD